jgi:hypothetical protein
MTPTPALHYELMRVLHAERIERAERHGAAVQANTGSPGALPAALRRMISERRRARHRRPDLVGAERCCPTC